MKKCNPNEKGGYVPAMARKLAANYFYNCETCGYAPRYIVPNPKYLKTEHTSDTFEFVLITEDGCHIRA